MKSLHFAPLSVDAKDVAPAKKTTSTEPAEPPAPEPSKNPYECYRDAVLATGTVSEKLKKLFGSENRHGDLQVIRSMALQIAEEAARMIEVEEAARPRAPR